MSRSQLVFAGRTQILQHIHDFCRQVYHRVFGPEEGEERFSKLLLVDALVLWQAGLPDSGLPEPSPRRIPPGPWIQ